MHLMHLRCKGMGIVFALYRFLCNTPKVSEAKRRTAGVKKMIASKAGQGLAKLQNGLESGGQFFFTPSPHLRLHTFAPLHLYTCGPLRSPAVPCGPLRSPAVPCGPLRSPAVPCGPLRSPAVPCGPLRSPAVPCGPLRSPAVPCGERSGVKR